MMNSPDKIWFLGRSYQEYLSMFNLDHDFLKDRRVLDCAAGASSFTAWACDNGINATATDVLYGMDLEQLRETFIHDFSTLLQVHSGLDQKVDWGFFQNSEEMIEDRLKTCNNFITHYEKHPERYVQGQLPHLPFTDGHFDLALSSHLLFLYDDRLDYLFHTESIQEMLRVAEEVRIYPIVSLSGYGNRSPYVKRIMEDIGRLGDVDIVKVDYRFRKGGEEMMRLKKDQGS
ncbi:MAG TPA: class I SAM-dependent methyltransferase [Methanobacteriaceae archaeon]|nr:class I SAM-dependent methyltransferase [Methanobacteriaceae archaeon]HNS24922.1 class I SAM-dependent methyltransferase [Methanobacteriaceae archaeon]